MGYLWGTFGVFVGLRTNYIMVTNWLSRGYSVMVTVVRCYGDDGNSHCWRAMRRCSLPRRRRPRVPLWRLLPAGGCAPPAFGVEVIRFATSGHKICNMRPQCHLRSTVGWGAPSSGWVTFYEGGRPAAGHAGGEDPLTGAGTLPALSRSGVGGVSIG